ncbi:hypothetical protein AG1IA_06927 [Rhizoctonia solani AG-1 IA]|uniref:Uncharacterized protein n=1 Tax=Thanatephorus cucumeris (strain AG1-IA) TaxID=983506 RepID=L8WQI7_THACA|nr:hypothetical protein AG1IA_06927 [Rhizoctonia solani AG-1 IA]
MTSRILSDPTDPDCSASTREHSTSTSERHGTVVSLSFQPTDCQISCPYMHQSLLGAPEQTPAPHVDTTVDAPECSPIIVSLGALPRFSGPRRVVGLLGHTGKTNSLKINAIGCLSLKEARSLILAGLGP